ncbi:hypothetical protein D9Q98_007200 [Chlorella vulgaris]|uniref:MYND-type domain-containing protein n=1 Tax=Chlorella vulgaris TaxID=3077 RepID=A0A9D4TJL7_CHLVU|nr:hypothetical protein D9Q98_007200 [Chlorella vulgaris]
MSQGAELRALLKELSRVAASSSDEDRSVRLLSRATDWRDTTLAAAEAGGGPVLLPSDFEAAGNWLVECAGRLTAAWAARSSSIGTFRVNVWRTSFTAAVVMAEGCARVITAGRAPPITTLAFCRCVELLLGPGRLLLDHFAAGCGLNAAKPFEVAAVLQTQLWLMELLFRRVLLCEDLSVHDEWLAQLAPPPAVVAWLESAAAVAVGLTPPAPSQTAQATYKVTAQMALVVFPLVMSTEVTPYAAAIKVSNSLQTNLAPMQQQQAGQLPADSHGWQSHGHDRRLAQQLVQVLPQLPFTMQLLVEGGQLQHEMECAESLGIGWCKALDLLQALVSLSTPSLASSSSIVSSWSELSAWCIACAALPRGQALTAVLIGQYESQPAAQRPLSKLEETLRTSRHLAILPAASAVQQELTGFGAPLPAATVAAAQTALWDLHTALCRSAHQQTAGNVDQTWHGNLDSTNQTLLTAWRLHQCVQRDISQPFGRHRTAMAAAHCQMLQAVVCDAGREAAVLQQEREHSILHCCNLASTIAVCGAMCPAVLTLYPALVDMQHRALLAVDGKLSSSVAVMRLSMAQAAAASPHVTAHMLGSGAMEIMLQQLESSDAQRAALLSAQHGEVAGLLAGAYQALVCVADDVLAAASSGSTAVETDALQGAQRSLAAVVNGMNVEPGVSGGGQAGKTAAAVAKALRKEVQPAAGQLAAALLVLWTGSEQRKQAALELARASAARSCAYLSCSNVCGGGGPAAGQGLGSQRCSQCHTAYYCGTACSHADWRRGGHGRVCRALAGTQQAAQRH